MSSVSVQKSVEVEGSKITVSVTIDADYMKLDALNEAAAGLIERIIEHDDQVVEGTPTRPEIFLG